MNRGWIPFEKKDLPEINLVDQNQIIGTLMLQTKPSTFKPENDIEKKEEKREKGEKGRKKKKKKEKGEKKEKKKEKKGEKRMKKKEKRNYN